MLDAGYESRFRGYHDLMRYRVREILLVSTVYDAWVLEQDHNLSERLFNEYVQLDLRYVPRITRVNSGRVALEKMRTRPFDMVLCLTRLPDMEPLEFRAKVREQFSGCPVVFLTYDALDTSLRDKLRLRAELDRVFYWFRDVNVLTSIVKNVEDYRNAPMDTRRGVQVILLVEDSPRYYSLFLPLIYTELLSQTRRLITEGVNDFERLQRMRARPKIILAETLQQARAFLRLYKNNIIGVISDVRYPDGDSINDQAGFILASEVKAELPDVPVLLQSSELEHRPRAEGAGCGFLHKDSQNLAEELRGFILEHFGFGDFVFRLPDGSEVARAANLYEFEDILPDVPDESILYHAARNHFSTWLRARSEFALAEDLRPMRVGDFKGVQELRQLVIEAVSQLTRSFHDGEVREFAPDRMAARDNFDKLGSGSLGGKGRGLAFINALLARNRFDERYPKVHIAVPSTFVLCTDVYEEFIDVNDLRAWAKTTTDDALIAERFQACLLPRRIEDDLRALLAKVRYPLAVRSSSLLEDNQTLPFAGIYSTYMLPNNHPDLEVRFGQLCTAIKQVYASIFSRGPREYIKNTGYRLDEERMAVVIQELAGRTHGTRHYPSFSGVARSYNYYPFAGIEPEDGTASLAVGLGKTIVESQRVYHFCPTHPRANPPWASNEEYLQNTQTRFYALDISRPDLGVVPDEDFSLLHLDIAEAEKDGVLQPLASSWSPQDRALRDYLVPGAPRVIRFAQILKYKSIPLSAILRDLLRVGEKSFGAPVEIEFAVDLDPQDAERADFSFLQIRPMVVSEKHCKIDPEALEPAELVCSSVQAMGNGRYDDIRDLVYLRPDRWDALRTREMAREIQSINERFIAEDRPYILLGFGRWATSDPLLGVPVKFDQVSRARIIIEADRHDLWVEPSQGSHFFQNMLALRLGYLFIKESRKGNRVDWAWLDEQEAAHSTHHFRHLRFEEPLVVDIDGRSSLGIIHKPGSDPPCEC
jgi:CheY-like chemotaxis protein